MILEAQGILQLSPRIEKGLIHFDENQHEGGVMFDDYELNNLLLEASLWGETREVKRLIEEEGLDANVVGEV
jgi:hypothetical protein